MIGGKNKRQFEKTEIIFCVSAYFLVLVLHALQVICYLTNIFSQFALLLLHAIGSLDN